MLYNRAITDMVVKRDNYPFNDFKVSDFHEQTMKRAISKEGIKREGTVFRYTCSDSR